MTPQRTTLPPQAVISLVDIRQTYSQTRLRFTKTQGIPRITREGAIAPDFITLTCLISDIYRSYGGKLEPVRQFHPSRETPYSKGHTSSVSHTQITRRSASVVSRNATTTISEGIIIKRPRKSILEQHTYALVSFITELRVRSHPPLREHPNIAQLRGVGWDFEDEEATIPRPLLLEELAPQGALNNFWARWNFVRLNFKSKLDLARNIAEGLRAMHGCGVVHGDVKPENILIFPRTDADNEFVAKLTDFGHSVFEYSHSKSLPAFTPQWCAPELSPDGSGPKSMGFHEMKLTDTYSYGLVVLSIMIGRPFHESIEDFKTLKIKDGMLSEAIELVSREDREKDDADLDLATIELLMRQTIRLRPKHRSLERCIKTMNHYDKINGNRAQSSSRDKSGRKHIMKELEVTEMVAIGHSTYSQTSHQLKAHIVRSLLRISNDSKDPRRLAAAWELSICYFSGFGVEKSFLRSAEWLSVASEGGVAAAQDYVAILHEAMNLPYQVASRQIEECQIPAAVSGRQPEVQGTEPESEDLDYTLLQERDYELDIDDIPKSSTHVATSKNPNKLLDILNTGTLQDVQLHLQDNPADLNCRDAEGNTPLTLAARKQEVDMMKFLLDQAGVDAGIPNRSGHTVLHFLPLFDDETIQYLVPKLARRGADLQREALAMPLGSEDIVLIPEIRCCSILNAILHGNLTLLECLLEAAHAEGTTSQCQVCEAASRFRRILAVSLSIFQASALAMLVAHVRDRGNMQDIGLKTIKVWAGSKLLPLHKIPFNSVAIGALDLPDSLFRAVNYGARYVVALEETITFLLSTEKNVEDLAYSIMTEAVETNNWEAVRFLLNEGEKRQFTKSWWMRGPLDCSPFMRSISLGFREIFKLFLEHSPTLLKRRSVVACWLSDCKHYRKPWDQYTRVLLGHSDGTLVPASEKKHDFNLVQRALWLSIDSSHQDCFFVNAILDAADPELIKSTENIVTLSGSQIYTYEKQKYTATPNDDRIRISGSHVYTKRKFNAQVVYDRRLDGGDFLEHAILSSVFSPATIIIDRFPDVFRTRSRWSHLCVWRSSQKSNIRDTSGVSILRILREGSYRQCRFVMERLLPLRACRTSSNIEDESFPREKHNSQEEGVQEWTRCPLSREEYHQLVTGNIRISGSDRRDLWNVVETQAKLGHPRSVSYLRQAILYGNFEALDEMLRRGWDPNGPLWARLHTPLQYAESITKRYVDFNELFKAWNPDLPQTDWMGSRTHAVVYEAYRKQHRGHSWSEWNTRLKTSQVILRKHGGKILPVTTIFTMENQMFRAWTFIAFVLIYSLLLPLTFTYTTERTWTSMSRGQKLAFSYLWSVLSVCLPPIFLMWDYKFPTKIKTWIPTAFLITVNQIILPILIIQVNWSPFQLSVASIEIGLWSFFNSI